MFDRFMICERCGEPMDFDSGVCETCGKSYERQMPTILLNRIFFKFQKMNEIFEEIKQPLEMLKTKLEVFELCQAQADAEQSLDKLIKMYNVSNGYYRLLIEKFKPDKEFEYTESFLKSAFDEYKKRISKNAHTFIELCDKNFDRTDIPKEQRIKYRAFL